MLTKSTLPPRTAVGQVTTKLPQGNVMNWSWNPMDRPKNQTNQERTSSGHKKYNPGGSFQGMSLIQNDKHSNLMDDFTFHRKGTCPDDWHYRQCSSSP